MSTRKASHKAASTPAATPFAAADWPRQQMALWTGGACALFRGFESMRRMQMKAAHDALAQYEGAARKLREPCSPTDLLALQADLLRFDTQGAALYWQQLGALVLEMQRQAMAGIAQAAETETEEVASSLQPGSWAMPGLAEFVAANTGARARH